jgi:hypothetical protein
LRSALRSLRKTFNHSINPSIIEIKKAGKNRYSKNFSFHSTLCSMRSATKKQVKTGVDFEFSLRHHLKISIIQSINHSIIESKKAGKNQYKYR